MNDSLISELDAALVAASKDIRLLNRLSWGTNVEQVFLDGWRKGRPALPDATQQPQPQPLDSTVEALEAIAGRCDPQHPVGGFLHDSALSYADLEAGQSEEESVRSAQRIFRSGDVRGGIVFTKDSVYLKGLLEVHTFLRVAIRENRPELIGTLFAGRLTISDTLRLAEPFASGWLQPPVYVPAWASDLRRLAAMMAYSAFVSQVKLEAVNLQNFLEMEQSLKELS